MIHSLRLCNFKCFRDQTITLAPLTLLSGLNGMGKSSVIQALLLLRQSAVETKISRLRLNGGLVSLGTATDLLYEDAEEELITFELIMDEQLVYRPLDDEPGYSNVIKRPFSYSFEYDHISDVLRSTTNDEDRGTPFDLLDTPAHDIDSATSALFGQHFHFTVIIAQLFDDEIHQNSAKLCNASHSSHLQIHDGWIKERIRLPDPRSGSELWQQCTERYPDIQFCAIVEQHLNQYLSGAEELSQIMKRFSELNRYAATWKQGRFDPDAIGSKISPESPETLRRYAFERTFLCPDGTERLFSWHSRFTPGAGRIYLFPDEQRHLIFIGYVGEHLPTILY